MEKVQVALSRRDFLKGMGAIGLLSLGGSVLAGCKTEKELRNIQTQLLWIKNTEFTGFYAADLKGYYAEEGIEVEIFPGGPGIVVPDLVAAGDKPIGVWGSRTSFIKSIMGGYDLKAFAACFQRSPAGLMSIAKYPGGKPGNPILTPRDAIGMRIGLQPGAIPGWTVIMKTAGIPLDDVEIVEVSWDPTPLFDGTVDGYWCYATNQPGIARLEGYEIAVLDASEWGDVGYGNFCLATQDTLDNDRDMVVGWLRATIRGWHYANAHIDELTKHTVEVVSPDLELIYEQQKAEAELQIDYMKSPLTERRGIFWMSPEVWYANVANLVELGELDTAVPVEQLMTLDILEEVYKDGKEALEK
ncbi:MAG: ABC transporter substrate-binding protein [Candidatus Hodarchaeales archaeon]